MNSWISTNLSPFIARRSKWIKVSVIAVLTLFVLGATSGFFVKRYLVNHSEEWLGRKIAIGSIFINPFRNSVSINDFQLFEKKSDSVFVSFDELYVNLVPYKLLFNKLQIEEVRLSQPSVSVIMMKETFNFDDLIERFSSSDTTQESPDDGASDFSYQIEEITLTSGSLSLFNSTFNGGIELENTNVACPLVSSNEPAIKGTLDFMLKQGGSLNSTFSIQLDSSSYQLRANGNSIDIGFMLPFVDKVMYASGVAGKIDVDMNLGGRFDSAISEASGLFRVSAFQLLDTLKNPSLKVDRFEITMDTVSALGGDYKIRHIVLDKPFLRFDRTLRGNNLMRSSPENDSTTMDGTTTADTNAADQEVDDDYLNFFRLLNDYFLELSRAYAVKNYAVDTVRIVSGELEFDDYTLNEKFSFRLRELSVKSAQVSSDRDSIKVLAHSTLNNSGILDAELFVMPKDTGDLHLTYSINELKVSDFSPYSEYYVAHPFWDGVVYFNSSSHVVNKELDSKNHLLVKHLEVGDKVMNKTAFNLPLKLAVSLLKDVHGNVDLTIPVKGNVDDPKFKVLPIVLKIFKDLIFKAAASPIKALAQTFNASEEDLRDVKYDYLQFEVLRHQAKSLNLLANVLNQKKDLKVQLIHMNNPEWEMNQYALFEAKRRYYTTINHKELLTFDDSVAVDRIQRLDSAFVDYLKTKTGKEVASDIEGACISVVGQEKISLLLNEMNEKRVLHLSQYLSGRVETPNRFSIQAGDEKDRKLYQDRPKFIYKFDTMQDSARSQAAQNENDN